MKRILILLIPLFLAACGLPKASIERVNALKSESEALAKTVDTEKRSHERWIESADAKAFVATARREKWKDAYFGAASIALGAASAKFADEIDPLLKRNSSDDSAKLDAAYIAASRQMTKAKVLLSDYQKRKLAVEGIRANSPKFLAESETLFSGMKTRTKAFLAESEKGSKEFPEKKDAIAELGEKAKSFVEKAGTTLAAAKAELSKPEPDYGIAADHFAAINQTEKESKAHCEGQSKRIGTLAASYSRVLVDMRVDYFATVTRVSWDESSDWTTDTNYAYPIVKIDAEMAKALGDPHWDENPTATASRGYFGSNKVLLGGGIWEKLGIDLWRDRPMSHDMAEYYVDTSEKYYHRYRVEENGKVSLSPWVEVNEGSFDSLEDYLGMALVSKAYGNFEDEAVKTPLPDGMEFVGNSAYGSWKPDGSGGHFWNWYGQYAFIRDALGGHQYSRTEWEDWRSNYRAKKPYHGPADDEDRYGSGGSVTSGSGHYQKAEYYRANPGDRVQPGSLSGTHRGSGPSGRGRGPGGSGK
jgi:hypothetical protein